MEDLREVAAARGYREKIPSLREHVARELANYPAIEVLIGFNPLESLYDQHGYHASFMANVLHFRFRIFNWPERRVL